jgi:hypothetical protein
VAGVPGRILLKIILMFLLGRPELNGRDDLRHDLAGPQAGCIYVVDRV